MPQEILRQHASRIKSLNAAIIGLILSGGFAHAGTTLATGALPQDGAYQRRAGSISTLGLVATINITAPPGGVAVINGRAVLTSDRPRPSRLTTGRGLLRSLPVFAVKVVLAMQPESSDVSSGPSENEQRTLREMGIFRRHPRTRMRVK